MAALVLSFLTLLFATVSSAQQVGQGLINSDQTYVVNDQGESIQQYGVGQLVYIVIDTKEAKDSKRKDFYRVTFDPTNIKGDGWVLKDKVKLMTGFHSVDGKEPTEYENKPEPQVAQKKTMPQSSGDVGTTDASTFLEELIKKDEQQAELKPVDQQVKKEAPAKKDENSSLQNDLEFLFQQDGEFKDTYKQTKAAVKDSMQKKVGVSKFTSSTDSFAMTLFQEFTKKMQTNTKQPSLPTLPFVSNLEDTSGLKGLTIPPDLAGVFFGQVSPKIGDSRLLKVKYYDQNLKQFTFEKVAKIPLTQPEKTIETLANDCYQFLSK